MSARPEASADGAPAEIATVVGLTHQGEGVVREGKTVFIPGALPGETVRFIRTRRRRQHDEGRLLEVLEPAAGRVAPRCAHFGVCGGCALQHLAPETQLDLKDAELRETLQRVGQVTPAEWLAPLRGPSWNYRRRARLGSKFVTKKERVVVGFRERFAPYVADVQRCEVLAPPVGALMAPLAELLTGLSIRQRLPQIEVAVAENAVALVLRVLEPLTAQDRARLGEFAATHKVRIYLQPAGLSSVQPLDPSAEVEPLRYGLPDFDVQLEFAPTDFVQVNAAVNEALVATAAQLLGLTPDAVVLDLYCGIGNFSLALARRTARVVGVEGEPALIERARHNARRNELTNAEFYEADLSRSPPSDALWLRAPYSHVLLDPPRGGAMAVLPAIARLHPQRIVYISCHPGSLARDVGALVHAHGFQLRAAGVLDMFPHTAHIESLAMLEPAQSASRP